MQVPPGVAAGHPATVEAGVRTLKSGGSAADAAVAATLTACVAESLVTGLAGGGFATYFERATGQVTCLDFFCAHPGRDGDASPAPMLPVNIRFGEVPIPYEIGGPSVGVPGVPAGCGEVHARWGRLPWSEVVAPAAELAREGASFLPEHATILPALLEAMSLDQGASAYAPGGTPIGGGDLLFHAGLADSLDQLATHGPASFYTGELAKLIVETVRDNGGILGPADLSAYRVLDCDVVTAPLAGSVVMGRNDLNRTIASIGLLPANFSTLPEPLRHLCIARALSGSTALLAARASARRRSSGIGETTNVTIVDAHGNACVITTTLGLGAGVWLPGHGVHLNSMLGEGELNTGDLAPGTRLSSMMCPLVVLGPGGELKLAAGAAGASRIRSALATTLAAVLADGLTVAEAVSAPRLHVVGGTVHIEPDFARASADAIADAGFAINRWTETNHYFGAVSAVGDSGAAGDHRRGGTALSVSAR